MVDTTATNSPIWTDLYLQSIFSYHLWQCIPIVPSIPLLAQIFWISVPAKIRLYDLAFEHLICKAGQPTRSPALLVGVFFFFFSLLSLLVSLWIKSHTILAGKWECVLWTQVAGEFCQSNVHASVVVIYHATQRHKRTIMTTSGSEKPNETDNLLYSAKAHRVHSSRLADHLSLLANSIW